MLESYLERKKIVAYVKSKGWWISKNIDGSCRGAPDRRMISPKTGRTIYVEIKRKGKTLSAVQKAYHHKLRCFKQTVWTVDTFFDFRVLLKQQIILEELGRVLPVNIIPKR